MRRSVFSGKEAAMDIISEVLDMAAEIVELIITEILRRKKEKRTRQNKENERSRKRQCTTK
jgi:uncharacterized spore protein YtfJ